MTDIILGIIIAIIMYFAIRSTIKHFHGEGGCCGAGSCDRVVSSDRNSHHYNYHTTVTTEGMKCEGCKTRIENAFNSRTGFYAIANYKKNEVIIHSKAALDKEDVTKTITDLGYNVIDIK